MRVGQLGEVFLRDEARHCRFGSLYFEWASETLDDAERVRLAAVALETLRGYVKLAASTTPTAERAVTDDEALELGWFEPARYQPLVRSVVLGELVPNLLELDLPLDVAAVTALFDSESTPARGLASAERCD